MERTTVSKNIVASVLLQLVTIISGFIVPKVILTYFGSNVNGLVSSLTQFLNYIQLLEGGLSSVLMAALYKPLLEKDEKKISGIINAAEGFFRKAGLIYVAYTVAIAVVYPLIFETGFSYGYSIRLVLVLGINLFVQYFFSLTYKILLNADRKVYYVSLCQVVIVCINTISVVITAHIFNDVLVLKLISAIIYFIQPIVYGLYVKRHYNIDKQVAKDNQAIKQRWDGFQINLAYFIHTNTDVVILTIFSTFTSVSIYSLYLLIVNALKSLVNSISQAILPSFGNVLARDNAEKTNKIFSLYEFGVSTIAVLLFSCGIALITPFVDVYTIGIIDANYHQPIFGVLLCLAEFVYCIREPYVAVSYSANHFKQVSKFAVVEAMLNILISVILVSQFGLIGVAIGTLLAMIYRAIAHIYYISKNIIYRPISVSLRNMTLNFVCILLISAVSFLIVPESISSYYSWIVSAIKVGIISVIIIGIKSYVFNKNELKLLLKHVK